LHNRTADHLAVACAFDLLMVNGDDLRRQPLHYRKLALGKLLLRSSDGIQYVEHAEGHGDRMFDEAPRTADRMCVAVGADSVPTKFREP
jgi:ATP-dependent DNA ligase